MRRDLWQIVVRLLDQIQDTVGGQLVLALAPPPLNVVLYEMPVLAQRYNPLNEFVQESIAILSSPTVEEIVDLLQLPTVIVQSVLRKLDLMGGVKQDAGGRWTIPKGAPSFNLAVNDRQSWRRMRQLLCYWPEREVMLPVLPRLRLRDLVELGVHQLEGEVRNWYGRCVALSEAEKRRRGLPPTIQLLPLSDVASSEPRTPAGVVPLADSPISDEEVLVSQCRLDVIALTWASRRCGVWELASRIWSRPTPPESSEGEPFFPGEVVEGLSLLGHLLGDGSRLDILGTLFDPRPHQWRSLLKEQEEPLKLDRDLNGHSPSIIVDHSAEPDEKRRWRGLPTHLAPDARLLCYAADSERMASAAVRKNDGQVDLP